MPAGAPTATHTILLVLRPVSAHPGRNLEICKASAPASPIPLVSQNKCPRPAQPSKASSQGAPREADRAVPDERPHQVQHP